MSWKLANEPSWWDRWIPGWLPEWARRLVRRCAKWGLFLAGLFLAVCLFYFYLSWQYDMDDVAKMPEHSVILDRLGEEYATIHGEKRRLITRSEIPDEMVHALLAREDARFYDHRGVDVKGLVRATLRNIKDMSFTQGASTLTMQLTRNCYELRAKSIHRKLLEMAVTLRIEGRYAKDEILSHYLNQIYFGSGCHGVEEAAQTYFGRSAAELNIGECALLVGIIRGPHLFSPFRNLEGSLIQRDEVLNRMFQCGFLTASEMQAARGESIRLVPENERHKASSYARESIRRQLDIILDEHDIRRGGLSIHTTLDTAMQRQCEQVLGANIKGLDEVPATVAEAEDGGVQLQASVVRMDPVTGGVLALCGGRDFAESPYNRALYSKRDLGPAFAPFLHAAAMERSVIALAGRPLQTGRQLGVDETIRLCERFGFSGPFQKTEDLYRGALGVSPLELAMASSVFSNKGKKPSAFFIRKITDDQGRELYKYQPNHTAVVVADVARDTEAEHKQMRQREGRVTTTSVCRDVWGIRLGSKDVTVLWMGYDRSRKMGEADDVVKAVEKVMSKLSESK